LSICDFTATPTGATLFALTATPASECSFDAPPPLALWRSDDAGLHWTRTTLPRQGLDEGMLVAGGTRYIADGAALGPDASWRRRALSRRVHRQPQRWAHVDHLIRAVHPHRVCCTLHDDGRSWQWLAARAVLGSKGRCPS